MTRIDISEPADFKRLVRPAYETLQDEDATTDAVLEIVVAPGEYAGKPLRLGSSSDERPVRVILRGSDPADPPVFTDMYVTIEAHQVIVEHVVFRDNAHEPSVFHVEGAENINLRHCAFIDNSSAGEHGDNRVVDLGGVEVSRAMLEDCWFIGNRAGENGRLLAFGAGHKYVTLKNCAFLVNQADVLIAPNATNRLEMNGCFFYEPGDKMAIAINSTETSVRVTSVFALENAANLLSYYLPGAGEFLPGYLSGVALYLASGQGALPANVRFDHSQRKPLTWLDNDALKAQIAHFSDQASQGHSPNIVQPGAAFGLD